MQFLNLPFVLFQLGLCFRDRLIDGVSDALFKPARVFRLVLFLRVALRFLRYSGDRFALCLLRVVRSAHFG